MYDTINRVSSEAVKKATSKTWDEWFVILDEEGAREMAHKEIARLLRDKDYQEVRFPGSCNLNAVINACGLQ